MTYVTLSALWLASRGSYKETTEGHNSHEPNLQNKIEALGNENITLYYYLYTAGPSSLKYPFQPTNVYLFRSPVDTCWHSSWHSCIRIVSIQGGHALTLFFFSSNTLFNLLSVMIILFLIVEFFEICITHCYLIKRDYSAHR